MTIDEIQCTTPSDQNTDFQVKTPAETHHILTTETETTTYTTTYTTYTTTYTFE